MAKHTQKISKGTSSAVIISVLIHVGLFLIATSLVIFTVVKKKEVPFEAPKTVERPKMKLKKPKVRVKKSSRPKSTTRIVSKANKAVMPSIELPEMSGMGDGLGDGGVGGFIEMPTIEMPSLMGSGHSIGSDLEGTFYDFKRNRHGTGIPYGKETFREAVRQFIKGGWNPSLVAKYYRSPRKLYATALVVPTVLSEIAPEAFGEQVEGNYWMVHYKGQLVCHRDITFRFVGSGDEMLVVRVDGDVSMAVAWRTDESQLIGDIWNSRAAETDQYWMGNQTATMGDWVTLKGGEAKDIEIMVTDNGGQACLMLGVEEKGVDYPMRKIGGPIFPVFRTADLSHDMLDVIYQNMVAQELCLTNGPIFNDFENAKAGTTETNETDPAETEKEKVPQDPIRLWTLNDGTEFKGEYKSKVGSKVVIKKLRGKQETFSLANFSEEDRQFVELENPPSMKLGVSYVNSPKYSIKNGSPSGVVSAYHYTFTGNAKQTSNATYNHELTVEFFAVGSEIHGDKYKLLDRQKSSFIPSKENQRSIRFTGRQVEMPNFILEGIHRGVENFGYLITVTDERGEIVAYKTSAKWLYENIETLKKLPAGRFMDRTCQRVYPTGPKRTRY